MSTALLMLLADGRLPTGGHALGGGIEWALRHDDFSDHAVLEEWIVARLATLGRVEAAFAVAAGHGVGSLPTLDAELSARIIGPRAREVSRQTARQLLRAARRIWAGQRLDALLGAELPGGAHYAIAFGTVAGVAGADPTETATLVLHHQVASAITGAVRLLAEDPIELAAMQARVATHIDDLAGQAETWVHVAPSALPSYSMPLAEVLAEDHGTWPSRLFVA